MICIDFGLPLVSLLCVVEVTLVKVHVPEGHQDAGDLDVPVPLKLLADLESIQDAVLRLLSVLCHFVLPFNSLHAIVVSQGL